MNYCRKVIRRKADSKPFLIIDHQTEHDYSHDRMVFVFCAECSICTGEFHIPTFCLRTSNSGRPRYPDCCATQVAGICFNSDVIEIDRVIIELASIGNGALEYRDALLQRIRRRLKKRIAIRTLLSKLRQSMGAL